MSLNTVIKIGKLYRQSKDSWQYHDQISFAMNDVNSLLKKKNYKGEPIETEFYEINVVDRGDSFSFNLENKKIITNEDKKSSIYYLNFKANKKDTFKKYLVGDIVYSCCARQRFQSGLEIVSLKVGYVVVKHQRYGEILAQRVAEMGCYHHKKHYRSQQHEHQRGTYAGCHDVKSQSVTVFLFLI